MVRRSIQPNQQVDARGDESAESALTREMPKTYSGVGAVARFGEAEGGDEVAVHERRQVLLLLRLRAGEHHRLVADRLREEKAIQEILALEHPSPITRTCKIYMIRVHASGFGLRLSSVFSSTVIRKRRAMELVCSHVNKLAQRRSERSMDKIINGKEFYGERRRTIVSSRAQ